MKYNDYLIVTIPDFRRHFNFKEFYAYREQFVRDMSPEKVYYWDESLIKAYRTIAQWIVCNSAQSISDLPTQVEKALKVLVDKEDIMNSELENADLDLSQPIIYLQSGFDLNLPALAMDDFNGPIDICLHKLVNDSGSNIPITIIIGALSKTLADQEVVYVSECGGKFIEFLPNGASNEFFEAKLIESRGNFGSILMIENKKDHEKMLRENVICFTLFGQECVSIDSNHDLSWRLVPETSELINFMMDEGKPTIIKSDGKSQLGLLYNNGRLRTTSKFDPWDHVFSFDFDGKVIITNNNK